MSKLCAHVVGVAVIAVLGSLGCQHGPGARADAVAKRPSAKRMGTFLTPGVPLQTEHTELLSLTDGNRTFAVLFGGYDLAFQGASSGAGAFRNQDPEWDLQAGWGILNGTMPMSTTPRVATGAEGSVLVVYASREFDWVFLLQGKCAEVRSRKSDESAKVLLGKICGSGDTGHTLKPGQYVEARTRDGVVVVSEPRSIDWSKSSDTGALLAFVQARAEAASIWPTARIPGKP